MRAFFTALRRALVGGGSRDRGSVSFDGRLVATAVRDGRTVTETQA